MSARDAAMAAAESVKTTPTSLISYQSNGRVVVLGDAAALALCENFTEPLQLTRIDMTATGKKPLPDRVALNRRRLEIEGHMGQFLLNLVDEQGDVESLQADLVLDLTPEPLIDLEIPPPGYLHVGDTERNSQYLEQHLLELTGEFDKPKYFNYDPSICAHGVNGKTVCTRCIDACPAGAIASLVETIEVDPYLCQGGGACSTACPSGAMQYVYPRLADNGNQVRLMLQAYREQSGQQAILMFHAEEVFPEKLLDAQDSILPLRVEELASVGPDLCLSALAYGASRVVLLAGDEIPELSRAQLNHQLEWLQSLLAGMGMDPRRIGLSEMSADLSADLSADFGPMSDDDRFEAAIYTMPNQKRHAIYQAVDHFFQQLKPQQELVELPQGAPFGNAIVDANACTLCMACVGACPGKALQDGSNREVPEIFFIEANCIQCGACTQTCPEAAISIAPRMIFDRERRNHSRSLNQDQPFGCISCGKPFAPTSVIHKMTDRLKDHYMFNSPRALDRLKMCEDCRVIDIVQDPEAMKGNFDPLN